MEENKIVETEKVKDSNEKDGKLLLKILQIIIGVIMAAFHI